MAVATLRTPPSPVAETWHYCSVGRHIVHVGGGGPANAGAWYGFDAKGVEPELGPYELNDPSCPGGGE